MRKSPSTDLFWLIKSLDKGEKRNLKLMAKVVVRGGAKRYMDLFDLLEKWDTPDEEALLRIFGSQLANIKHYLHGLVLRSLSHFDTSNHAFFANVREQARILTQKELYAQAEKLLDRTIEDAKANEWWEELVHLLSFRIELESIVKEDQDGEEADEKIDALRSLEIRALRNHHLIRDYAVLDEQVKREIRASTYPEGTPARRAWVDAVMALPCMRLDIQQLPVLAQYYCHSIICRLVNDVYSPTWRKSVEAIHALFSEHATVLERHRRKLLIFHIQMAGYQAQSRDFEHVQVSLLRCESIAQGAGGFRYFCGSKLIWLKVYIEICRGDVARLAAVLAEVEQEVKLLLNGKVGRSEERLMCQACCFGHFMLGKPQTALGWLNRLTEISMGAFSHIVQVTNRKWKILIHFDLGNHSVVSSELNSLKRYFSKRGKLSAGESFFLRTIRKLLKSSQDASSRALYEKQLSKYEALLQADPYAEWEERTVHFWAWLRAKTDGMPPCVDTWYLQRSASLALD
jgi:hypothetical protein